MYQDSDPGKAGGPSRKSLIRGILLTLVGAIVVTVVFVMPAEYGTDPTGLGERLGLTRLGGVSAPEVDATPRIVEGTWPVAPPAEEFDYFDPEVLGDPFSRTQERPFRSATMIVELADLEQVEVKASMKQGDALVYSWRMLQGDTVYTDFHADPHAEDQYPEGYWIRYLESESNGASGSLVAPFDGNHGWYWLNIEEGPVTIELQVHGYYDTVDEIMRSFQ
jgi:hypothetical protein